MTGRRIRRISDARLIGGGGPVDLDLAADGTIAAVWPAGTTRFSGEALEAGGRFVTSGLWDEHVHVGQWAQQATRIDLGELVRLEEVLDRVAGAAAVALASAGSASAGAGLGGPGAGSATAMGAEPEVIAMRARGSAWGDELSRERLDAVTGEVPTVLVGADLHGAWLNSAALRRHGRDPAGSAHLVEDDCFALLRELDRVSDAELDRRVLAAARAAAARGVVGVVDFEMRWGVEDWARREHGGFDALRVESAVYPQFLDRAIDEGLRSGSPIGSRGLLTVGPLKVITDGSLGTRTAWCDEPYPGTGHDHGRALVDSAELVELLGRAARAGFSAAVHAIGDRAAAQALDAFAWTGCTGRMEHAQLLRAQDHARFAQLGIAASVQPEHLLDDREAIARLWPGRAERAFPFASLLRAGVSLRFGSDAPVAPLDPWRAIAAAVHRAGPGETAWQPDERLTVEQALRASMRGQLRPRVGDPADLILLDEDPLRLAHPRLLAAPVSVTLVGGVVTFGG